MLLRAAVRRKIRAPFHAKEEARTCPRCGDGLDCFGDHAVACRCGGDITSRHNLVRGVLYDIFAQADLAPVKEKAGLLPARADGE